uniref:Uncharacterized protein n=1 Tax=Meloidogyne enterolobii TaxID=390850 RepID=A0A6V7VNR5_MELEN|nr:unnamed protein product [Meloidogyne enterolobii]
MSRLVDYPTVYSPNVRDTITNLNQTIKQKDEIINLLEGELKKRSAHDRVCCICGATHSQNWYRHSEPEHYKCNRCYNKHRRAMKKADKIKQIYQMNDI